MSILGFKPAEGEKEAQPKVQDVNSTLFDENQLLRASLGYLKTELNKFKELPLLVCDVKRVIDGDKAVIRVPNGNNFLVNIAGNLNLESGDNVVVEQKSLTIIQKMDKSKTFSVENFVIIEKPNLLWENVGGLEDQIREIKEVIELPLTHPELFREVGIDPPKGILLYGSPGTGKTILAKAVATSTNSTFIEIVAPELVQKFIGEGAKLVKDIFQLAREKAPSIVFIDEIDALAAERVELGTSGEREVQRTFMQLLTEMDGFKGLDNVKIIAATNRIDILDQAILRPGRFDRLIEIPLPEKESREKIFKIHSRNMKLAKKLDLAKIVSETENFSGADIKSVCTEAGYFAIRENRKEITTQDFLNAINKITIGMYDEAPSEMFG